MRRAWLRTAVLLFWLGMMGWLIRYEAFPDYFSHTLSGYRSLISSDVLMEESWMRILFNDVPIGYSHTLLDVDEGSLLQHCTLMNRTEVRLNLMGASRRVHLETTANLDIMFHLQRFAFELSSGEYGFTLKGFRREGENFEVALRTGESSQRMRIEIPDDVVLYAPLTEAAVLRLKPGEHLVIRTLDPATLSTAPVTIRALRQEPLVLDGVAHRSTVLSAEYHGLTVLTWVDEQGAILREETPLGWTLERCTEEQAFEGLISAADSGDLLRNMAVRLRGELRDPERRRALRLRLSGVPLEPEALGSHRQIVERVGPAEADLRVLAQAEPAEGGARAAPPPELGELLAASAFVQADHPEIVARARSIAGSAGTPWERACALHQWVHAHVEKEITVSLPSALDVLRTLKGDCNEHTYLFVALARAAGIPAKIRVGVVHQDGAFYYHAWPAVHVGEWVEMDPTLGQRTVDATHIALLEGELVNQLDLLKVIGRLNIEVLDDHD